MLEKSKLAYKSSGRFSDLYNFKLSVSQVVMWKKA